MSGEKELDSEVQEWVDIIDEMIDSGDYVWAEEKLLSMGEWMEDHNHITYPMQQAIENIRDSIK